MRKPIGIGLCEAALPHRSKGTSNTMQRKKSTNGNSSSASNNSDAHIGSSATASLDDPSAPLNVLRIKVISMGDGGVGKSCVIKRYCEGMLNCEDYLSIEYHVFEKAQLDVVFEST